MSEPGGGHLRRRDVLSWLSEVCVRRSWYVIAIWAALAAVSGVGASKLEIDTTTSTFLDRDAPAWSEYQRSIHDFGGDELLTIVLEGPTPYDPKTLQALYELSGRMESLPGVRRVDSLRTVPVVDARRDGSIALDPPLEAGVPATNREMRRLVEKVRKDRVAPNNLVSADERAFAINVLFDDDVDGDRDVAVAIADGLLTGRSAWISGVPVFRTKVNSRTRDELLLFVPLTLALVGGVILVGIGGLWSVAVAFTVSGCGTLVALGAMGFNGVPISLSTAILPSILLALGCAYVLHVLSAARGAADAGDLIRRLNEVARPVALSGLTTAIGFIAMATVRVSAIRELSTYGGLGIFAVVSAGLTLAPALLRQRGLERRSTGFSQWMEREGPPRLVAWVRSHAKGIVLAWIGGAAVFGYGLGRLRIETDIILWFPRGTEIRESYEAIKTRLSGISPMNVVIRSEGERTVTEPDVIETIDRLTAYLKGLPEVGKVLSIADPLRQIHSGFEGNGAAGLPHSRALTEQYLLLLESVDQIADVVSDDRRSANILLRVDVNGSKRLLEVGRKAEDWWKANGVPGFSADSTGIMYEFGRAEEEIAYGQIRGLAIAFGVMVLVLLALLKSPLGALGALLPNVLPLGVVYGLMGIMNVPLDAATVCVGCIALGIAIDDTVHIVTGYGDSRSAGLHPRQALEWTFRRVLPPVVLTTIAIAAGFAVLGISEFTLVRNFGLVTAGMVVTCLLADLTLLPIALLWAERSQPGRSSRTRRVLTS